MFYSAIREAAYKRRPRDAGRQTSRDPIRSFPELDELRHRYGVAMRLIPQSRYDASKGLAIEIYGDHQNQAQNVKKAIDAIKRWISEYTDGKSVRSGKFPKASSVIASQTRHRELEAWNKKHSYCQDPTEEELDELHSVVSLSAPLSCPTR